MAFLSFALNKGITEYNYFPKSSVPMVLHSEGHGKAPENRMEILR